MKLTDYNPNDSDSKRLLAAEVRWAGFTSTVQNLIHNGWNVLVDRQVNNFSIRLKMSNRGEVVALTNIITEKDLRYCNLIIFNIVAINSKIYETRIHTNFGFTHETTPEYEIPKEYCLNDCFNKPVTVPLANQTVLDHLEAIKKLQVKETEDRLKKAAQQHQTVLARIIGV